MPAQPEPVAAGDRPLEPHGPADDGVQPVGADRVPRADPGDGHPVGVLLEARHPDPAHLDAEAGGASRECAVQREAFDAAARRPGESVGDGPARIRVPEAGDRHARRIDAEAAEDRDRAGHEALAAGLVDQAGTGLEHHRLEPLQARGDRRREPDRAAADDDEVRDHERLSASARDIAASSAGIRNRSSSRAFRIVKTSAVTQLVKTSGSAMPSSATAT